MAGFDRLRLHTERLLLRSLVATDAPGAVGVFFWIRASCAAGARHPGLRSSGRRPSSSASWIVDGEVSDTALYGLLEQRLAERAWIMGDNYTIADIATFPWVRNLVGYDAAGELVGIADFAHVLTPSRQSQGFALSARSAAPPATWPSVNASSKIE